MFKLKLYRVSIDWENNGLGFWSYLRNPSPLTDLTVKLGHLRDYDFIYLTDNEIMELQEMPFWHNGPNHAPNPLVIVEMETVENEKEEIFASRD